MKKLLITLTVLLSTAFAINIGVGGAIGNASGTGLSLSFEDRGLKFTFTQGMLSEDVHNFGTSMSFNLYRSKNFHNLSLDVYGECATYHNANHTCLSLKTGKKEINTGDETIVNYGAGFELTYDFNNNIQVVFGYPFLQHTTADDLFVPNVSLPHIGVYYTFSL